MSYSAIYLEYLQSPLWRKRRQAKLEEAGNKCRCCPEKDNLQVHHITYEHLGDEQSNELVVLCTAHHWVADEIRRTGNMDLLKKFDKPFEKPQKPKKEKHIMSKRELKLLRRKKKHERSALAKTLHRSVSRS